MENREYNGWTNYETWCVNLHISCDEMMHDWLGVEASDSLNDEGVGNSYKLAQKIKDHFEEAFADLELKGVFSDLLGSALSEVNWEEIAGTYVEVAELEWKEENSDE